MSAILELKNLGFIYGKGTPFEKKAVDNVSLTIEKGEFIGIIGISPDNANARLGLAMIYQREKQYDKAGMLLGLLIEEHPGNASFYIARSDLMREQGFYELALMDIAKAIELEPDNPGYYTLQAILYEKTGKDDAAAKSRRKAAMTGEPGR